MPERQLIGDPDQGLIELRPLLGELGRRWAASPHRPRVQPELLLAWESALQNWFRAEVPLLLRHAGRRGKDTKHSSGRDLFFGDNSPANWAFARALDGRPPPDIATISRESLPELVPLTFTSRGEAAKGDLNKRGWKICHIKAVAERQRGEF